MFWTGGLYLDERELFRVAEKQALMMAEMEMMMKAVKFDKVKGRNGKGK